MGVCLLTQIGTSLISLLGPIPPSGLRPVEPEPSAPAPLVKPAAPVPAEFEPPPSPEEFFSTGPRVRAQGASPRLRAPEAAISPRELHARVAPAVVALVVTGTKTPPSVVAGTMVAASGLIITSRSALAGVTEGDATLAVVRGGTNGRLTSKTLDEAVPARLLAVAEDLDLALVEAVPRASVFYPHLPIARRRTADGESVLAVGHAAKRGLWAATVTKLGPVQGGAGAARWIRTSGEDGAAALPGAPLVDSVGRVVALVTARGTIDSEGLLRFLLAADAPRLRFAGVAPQRRRAPSETVTTGRRADGSGERSGGTDAGDSDADAMPGVTRKGVLDRRFSVPGSSPAARADASAGQPAKASRGPAHVSFDEGMAAVPVPLGALEGHAPVPTLRLDAADAPSRGAAAAPVTIVELGDYHAPDTRQVEPIVRALVEGADAPARLVWKDADRGDGADYHMAARAARAAHEQDQFWDMHDLLLRGGLDPNLDKVRGLAHELELDERAFTHALVSPGSLGGAELEAHRAAKLPVLCTPSFTVNGRIVEGGSIAGPALQAAVDDELSVVLTKTSPGAAGPRAPRAIAPGGPIGGASFDPARMARAVAEATRRGQSASRR